MVSGGIKKDGMSKSKVDPTLVNFAFRLTQICVYSVISGSMVDLLE